MSTFACPKCEAEYDIGDYPDHITDMRNNEFWFECQCGVEFKCEVDWEPIIEATGEIYKPLTEDKTHG